MNKSDKRRRELITRLTGKPGLRGRIDAKCVECIFDPIGGGGSWRAQVAACTGKTCPLYEVRAKRDPEARDALV